MRGFLVSCTSMAKIKRVYVEYKGVITLYQWQYWCQGCRMIHGFKVHTFDEKYDRPTISPSLLTTYKWKGVPVICHSYIEDGKQRFLLDCTHHLAGQTVELTTIDPFEII